MEPASVMEEPKGATSNKEHNTTADDVSDSSTGLEGSCGLLLATEQEAETLCQLGKECQDVEDHLTLAQGQVDRVRPEALYDIQDHGWEAY